MTTSASHLCIQNVMHAGHVVPLPHDTAANTAKLLRAQEVHCQQPYKEVIIGCSNNIGSVAARSTQSPACAHLRPATSPGAHRVCARTCQPRS